MRRFSCPEGERRQQSGRSAELPPSPPVDLRAPGSGAPMIFAWGCGKGRGEGPRVQGRAQLHQRSSRAPMGVRRGGLRTQGPWGARNPRRVWWQRRGRVQGVGRGPAPAVSQGAIGATEGGSGPLDPPGEYHLARGPAPVGGIFAGRVQVATGPKRFPPHADPGAGSGARIRVHTSPPGSLSPGERVLAAPVPMETLWIFWGWARAAPLHGHALARRSSDSGSVA